MRRLTARDLGPSRRRRLSEGVYRVATGIVACVKVGSGAGARKRRRTFAPGTPLDVVRAWRVRTRAELTPPGGRPRQPVIATLDQAIDVYLLAIGHRPSHASVRSSLRAWAAALGGARNPWQLTPADILRARSAWAAAAAPKTINNRLADLRTLWRAVIDPDGAHDPTRGVRPLAVPRTPPAPVPPAVIEAVSGQLLAALEGGRLRNDRARARMLVMATTGRRPSEIARAVPADVDLRGRRVWSVRDGKGGWSPGVYLPASAHDAWTVFCEADAWGPWNVSSWVRTLRAVGGWPAEMRPYALRASVGIAMSEAGIELSTVGAALGHTRPSTTRAHYVPVLGSRLEAAAEALERVRPLRIARAAQMTMRHLFDRPGLPARAGRPAKVFAIDAARRRHGEAS